MLYSSWLKRNPHFIVLVIYLILLAPFVYWIGASKHYQRAYENYATSHAYADAQREFRRDCGQLSKAQEILDCFEQKIEAAREVQRAEEDLQAQQSMADWAFGAVIVAGIVGLLSITLTFVGVVFIRDTLHETQRTTAAAIEANQITQTSAEQQLRAYVHVKGANIRMNKDRSLRFTITYKNFGQTPAYKVEVRHFVSARPIPLRRELEELERPDDFSRFDLAPTAWVRMKETTSFCITPWIQELIDRQRMSIFLFGRIEYLDIFQNPRVTQYRYIYVGPWGGKRTLEACRDGNEAT